jgi:hypothetical protein
MHASSWILSEWWIKLNILVMMCLISVHFIYLTQTSCWVYSETNKWDCPHFNSGGHKFSFCDIARWIDCIIANEIAWFLFCQKEKKLGGYDRCSRYPCINGWTITVQPTFITVRHQKILRSPTFPSGVSFFQHLTLSFLHALLCFFCFLPVIANNGLSQLTPNKSWFSLPNTLINNRISAHIQ